MDTSTGFLIGGCHPGDYHYQSGNYKSRWRVAILQCVLEQMGFDPKRVWLRWISTSEGPFFADTVTDMVAELKRGDRIRQRVSVQFERGGVGRRGFVTRGGNHDRS